MKITTTQELQPFTTPNFVVGVRPPGKREEGFKELPKYALSELSDETLAALCDKFRAEVFEKARKK